MRRTNCVKKKYIKRSKIRINENLETNVDPDMILRECGRHGNKATNANETRRDTRETVERIIRTERNRE